MNNFSPGMLRKVLAVGAVPSGGGFWNSAAKLECGHAIYIPPDVKVDYAFCIHCPDDPKAYEFCLVRHCDGHQCIKRDAVWVPVWVPKAESADEPKRGGL